ncbi:aprataxin-like [Agrilus planipennis]|uniref:Aprataxin-like n=1 Tax=Agrilus planipennis TaxID=224129 RepID=A0A1W4WAF8_AGRPL|nr:aprataxin-like [Agrilus planipennis]XP_025836834.1 aprataxin-like [Agrilus planipennis]
MSGKTSKRKSSSNANSSNKKVKTENQTDKKGHWAFGLLSAVNDPKLLITEDDKITIIKDKYPKAEVHYLVLPKEDIKSLKAVQKEHTSLLKHMEKVGERIFKEKHPGMSFKMGYHSEPSMTRLHLHVISDDMKSDCLKTKKHWNSFNTDFFLNSTQVREQLESLGKIIIPSAEKCKEWMSKPLKCHKCDFFPLNMPDLKRHLSDKH